MRWTALIAAAGALAAPATALADQQIVASAPNRYVATSITMDQGEPLTFRNDDVSGPSHDVVSTANGPVQKRYLFASETIPYGETSFVEGSQYLTTGTYDFFCSLHPDQMKGTLNVTSAGSPKPRPGAAPPGSTAGAPRPADETPPEATLWWGSLRARTLARRRRLTLTVGADEAVSMRVHVTIGARRLAPLALKFERAGRKKVAIRIGRTARRALAPGRRVKVRLEVADPAGNLGSATDAARLR